MSIADLIAEITANPDPAQRWADAERLRVYSQTAARKIRYEAVEELCGKMSQSEVSLLLGVSRQFISQFRAEGPPESEVDLPRAGQ